MPNFTLQPRTLQPNRPGTNLTACLLLLTLAASALTTSPLAEAASVWSADDKKLYRLDTATAATATATTPPSVAISTDEDITALVVADDQSVWTLDKKTLKHLTINGALLRSLELKNNNLKDADLLTRDPYNGSLWLQANNPGNGRQLVNLDASGNPRGGFTSPASNSLRALAVGLDGSLWLLGNKRLWHYSDSGSKLAEIDLSPLAQGEPKWLAVDSLGVWLWLSGEKQLLRLNAATPSQAPLKIALSEKGDALALDAKTGTLWLITDERLKAFSEAGALTVDVKLEPLGVKDAESLAFDAISNSVYVGFKKGIARFSPQGNKTGQWSTQEKVEVIGVVPFSVSPTLTLLAPADGSITNQAAPTISLGYGAICNAGGGGSACDLGDAFLQGFRPRVILDGQDISAGFVYDPANNQSPAFVVTRTLPSLADGSHVLQASVSDGLLVGASAGGTGHSSATISARFTIDTVAPRLTNLSPADGASFSSPAVTLTGLVNEAATLTLTGGGVGGGGSSTTASTNLSAPGSFSFPLTLAPGANRFTLTTVDRAGNVASQSLTLTLAESLQVHIDAPLAGARLTARQVLVSGSFTAPSNSGVTVNGVPAVVTATATGASFQAVVPLAPGSNSVTALVSTLDGRTQNHSIPVSYDFDATAPVLQPDRSLCLAPCTVSLSVSTYGAGTMPAVAIDYEGDGSPDDSASGATVTPVSFTHTYATPGVYRPRIQVTEADGSSKAAESFIVVQAASEVDAQLRRLWGDMLGRLSQGDIEGTLRFFSADAAPRYREAFADLAVPPATVAAQLGRMHSMAALFDGFAEYALVRESAAGNELFYVYFIQDENGLWRINSL